MRVLSVVLAGAAALLAPGCCSDDTSETRPAVAGSYYLGTNHATCIDVKVPPLAADPEQHRLTLSGDRKVVTETFVRGGRSYVVTYDVLSIDPRSL
jgi:hypothetical protein